MGRFFDVNTIGDEPYADKVATVVGFVYTIKN